MHLVLVNLGCYSRKPQTGWLKQHLFLTVLGAGKSKIKVLVDSVSRENPFPGSKTVFSLCPLWWMEQESSLGSPIIPIMRAPIS